MAVDQEAGPTRPERSRTYDGRVAFRRHDCNLLEPNATQVISEPLRTLSNISLVVRL
jgi:hypothetical protein